MNNSAFAYYPANEPESLFVKCIWRLCEYNEICLKETILPKGTVELIFNLSEKIFYLNSGSAQRTTLPTCFLNGINFKPFQLVKKGQQVFLGIQFHVIGLKGLFNTPAKEFNDSITEGGLICKSLDTLQLQLFEQHSFNDQVNLIRSWLHCKINQSKQGTAIQKIHNWFYNEKHLADSVKNLRKNICVSERQLRRIASEWLGMNPECFLLYNKYLTSLQLLHRPGLSLTQIGLEAGYYDQSHFIREFKSFTGLTPKEYQSSVTGLPGHIFQR